MDAKVSSIQSSTVLPVGERASPQLAQAPERAVHPERAAHAERSAASPARPESARPSEPTKPAASDPIRDLRLQFRVDPRTNDIVVLMIDRATKRVVRAIPPQELAKFDKGQLLELIA
jgi:hypothetical protein